MNGKKALRVALDVLMTVMIVFEMLIQFTGEFLHEVMGFAFFATVLAHVLLSAKWVKSTARAAGLGKMTARRTALAVVGILLAVTTVVLGVSSVAISGILASAGFTWTLGSYALWKYVHTVSAYALCALVVVHLAMHWVFLASALRVPYDPSRRRAISAGVNTVAALGVVALGATVVGKQLPQASASVVDSVGTEASVDAGSAGASGASDVSSATGGSGASSTTGASAGSTGSAGSSDSGRGPRGKKSGSSAESNSAGSAAGSSSTGSTAGPNSTGSSESLNSGGGAASSASGGQGSSSSSSASGICTLCRKQCSLSSPKCDKPYAAGLL